MSTQDDRFARSKQSTSGRPIPRITSDRYRVGGGYSIQLSADGSGQVRCHWMPSVPSRRNFERKVDKIRYEAALADFCEALVLAMQPDKAVRLVLLRPDPEGSDDEIR